MKRSEFKKVFIFLLIFNLAFLIFKFSSYAIEIKKQTISNGMTVLHVQRSNLPIVMVTLLIKASSLDEPSEKAGLAHLTSKMLTEGTHKRKGQEINEEIEFIGASLNISTNSDYTTMSLSVLKKDMETAFEIFSDVLLNPSFPEDEINRKKQLIKGSLRQSEEDPSFIASRAFIKEVFGGHPYGRLITGSAESIDRITRDDILKFYKEHYSPEDAILSVVGDITPTELDYLVGKYIGQWKTDDEKQRSEVKSKIEKGDRGKKIVVIDKNVTQANIIFGHVGISRDNPDYYAVSVMNYILGAGGFASRLMKTVREEMGLAYSIHSSFIANKYPGQFEIEVQTKNESAETVVKEILRQVKRIREEPVTAQELEDAKAYLTGSFPRRLETSRKIADLIAAIQFYGLGDDYIERYAEYINRVSVDDIQRVARKYLDIDNYVLVIVGNEKKMQLQIQDLK